MKAPKYKLILFLMITVLITSSCANTKKDCQGNRKHRLENGVWL